VTAPKSHYRVAFAPEVRDKLDELEARITAAGAPATAARYIDAIVDFCESLATFPWRGVPRDDLLPGLRMTHYRKRTVIAYQVNGRTVSIVGLYYGGQNYEGLFGEPPDQGE
jgi:plasmid stabilization system protein ParE